MVLYVAMQEPHSLIVMNKRMDKCYINNFVKQDIYNIDYEDMTNISREGNNSQSLQI